MLFQALLFHTDNHKIVKVQFMSQPPHIPNINCLQEFWLNFVHQKISFSIFTSTPCGAQENDQVCPWLRIDISLDL